jgi:hypothetical protein
MRDFRLVKPSTGTCDRFVGDFKVLANVVVDASRTRFRNIIVGDFRVSSTSWSSVAKSLSQMGIVFSTCLYVSNGHMEGAEAG